MDPLRYVVLHHTGIDRPHFDLLFEIEPGAGGLTSLRCPTWPPRVGDVLEELAEHRLLYLEYEGPISGNRGEVSRTDAGRVGVADLGVDPPTLGLRLVCRQTGHTIDLTLVHGFDSNDHAAKWTVISHAKGNPESDI